MSEQNDNNQESGAKLQYSNRAKLPDSPGQTVRRLLNYFNEYKLRLIVALLIWSLNPIITVLMNYMLQPIVRSMLDQDVNRLIYLLVVYVVVLIVRLISIYIGQRMMMILAQDVTHRLREQLFTHLMGLPIPYFDQNKKGNIMSIVTNDVILVEQALSQSLPTAITSIISFVGTVVVMIFLEFRLSLIVVAFLALMLLTARILTNISGKLFRTQQSQLGNMMAFAEEMLHGQKVVKVFNHEAESLEEFTAVNEELRVTSHKASALSVLIFPLMGNLSYTMYAVVAMVGALMNISGALTIDVLVTFLQYSRTVSMPITQIANQMNIIIGAIAGSERIFNVLDEELEQDTGVIDIELLENGERNWLIPQEDGSIVRKPTVGHIRFQDVDFGYVEDKQILYNIDLWAKPGQSIAFVGSTGAGKTTVTNLINRFYEIDSGKITYDDIDIRDIKKDALRSTLGMVLQDVHLFKGSILENIRYGRLDATDQEVYDAAYAAYAHAFIGRLPDKYETELTSDGLNLSEGERQLISIARAAIARPVVIILDEATSSVDTRLEKLIGLGMSKIREGRTTFSIAHRLSTVRDANAILVLEQGKIIERGDHRELMRQQGRYFDLNEGNAELE